MVATSPSTPFGDQTLWCVLGLTARSHADTDWISEPVSFVSVYITLHPRLTYLRGLLLKQVGINASSDLEEIKFGISGF